MIKKDFTIIAEVLKQKHKELSEWSLNDETPPASISLAYIEDFINELGKHYDNFNRDIFINYINKEARC